MEPQITRTFRAAIRCGEDFITVEETIALPIDASDGDIARAMELGRRIFDAQRQAAADQIEEIRPRASAPTAPSGGGAGYTGDPFSSLPDMPATMKQRNYIAMLQDKLDWSNEQLAAFAQERSVDLVDMTKPQASAMIEEMKRLADTPRAPRPVEQPAVPMFSDDDLPF